MSQVFLLVFVLNVPAFGIWNNALHIGVEFASRVDVTLFSKALYVLLDFLATRVLVNKVLVLFVVEAWELVQLTWHLQSRICGMTAPKSTNIFLRFEESAVNAQALETIHSLETSNASTDNADLLNVAHSSRKGTPLVL